jgi:hypothetical protein
VAVWKARKVAQATRHLSRSAAMHVDAAVAPSIAALPWGRFETLLQAKIIEADPGLLRSRPRFGRRNGSSAPAAPTNPD